LTLTARNCAFALGLTLDDVVQIIQSMKQTHFYKSMTAKADHRLWQDVYHVPWQHLTPYVKLTVDADGSLILSLKEQ
jgi:motility quorum-sensing regulator / GCU-specific mRNA interferase toxin